MQGNEAFTRIFKATQVVNSLMEWDGEEPSAPLLWMNGGHPKLPVNQQLFAMEAELKALAAALRSGKFHALFA